MATTLREKLARLPADRQARIAAETCALTAEEAARRVRAVVEALREAQNDLERMGVTHLAVFGSVSV